MSDDLDKFTAEDVEFQADLARAMGIRWCFKKLRAQALSLFERDRDDEAKGLKVIAKEFKATANQIEARARDKYEAGTQ